MKNTTLLLLTAIFFLIPGRASAQIADPTAYLPDFNVNEVYYFVIDKDNNRVAVVENGYFLIDPEAIYMSETPGYYPRLSDTGDIIYSGSYKGDIVVPPTVEHDGKTYTVTRIHYGAFANSVELLSVKLPPTINDIWAGAFFNCPKLKSVAMGDVDCDTNEEIFGLCPSLETLDLSMLDGISSSYFSSDFGNEVRCTSLREITLPTNIKSFCILRNMPKDDKTGEPILRTIKTKNPKPQTIGNFSFDDYIYALTTLSVPKGSADLYRAHYQWGKFANIAEEGSADIAAVEAECKMPVRIDGCTLTAFVPVKVYDMLGHLSAILAKNTSATLAPGLYVLVADNGAVTKIALR